MAILVKLDDVLYARRMTLTQLADRIGITLANLSILKTGKARAVRFSTLEAICEALQCQPGDLLQYAPEARATGTAAAPASDDDLSRSEASASGKEEEGIRT